MRTRLSLLLGCALLGAIACLVSLPAATLTWTNRVSPVNAANRVWSAGLNWNPNAVPQNGDTLIFTGSWLALTNNLAGLSLNGIIFTNGGNYCLWPKTSGNNGTTVGSGGVS